MQGAGFEGLQGESTRRRSGKFFNATDVLQGEVEARLVAEIEKAFKEEKQAVKRKLVSSCMAMVQVEARKAEAAINSDAVKSEQDLQSTVDDLKAKLLEKLEDMQMEQKNQIVDKRVAELTIKGLKTLLWRQKNAHSLEIKKLEQRLSL